MMIGDHVTELVTFGDESPKPHGGRVVWIHPRRIFYVVEFEVNDRTIRESYYFPRRRGRADA